MEVITEIAADGKGRFYSAGNASVAAEMDVSVSNGVLTAYHTEVKPEFENQGLAKALLGAMASYARANSLSVMPHCPFVSAQFRRHPEDYGDLWNG